MANKDREACHPDGNRTLAFRFFFCMVINRTEKKRKSSVRVPSGCHVSSLRHRVDQTDIHVDFHFGFAVVCGVRFLSRR